MENSVEVPQKTEYRTTIWPNNPTLGHISRQKFPWKRYMHPYVHCSSIAKTWKQPKCPSTEEWFKLMWYIYTMEYYSAIKRKKILAFLATWMDLETIVLSEVRHTMRCPHPMLSLICGIWKKDRLNFFSEQMLTHRHWKTYGLWRRQFWGWGGCAWAAGWKSCEIGLLWLLYNYICDKFIWVIKSIKK